MQNLVKKCLFFFGLLMLPLILTGCQQEAVQQEPVTLEYWGTYEHEAAFNELVAKYQETRPYVTINYTQFQSDVYEKKLLNALAEDRGPDLFSVPHVKFRTYQSKIVPLEKSYDVSVVTKDGQLVSESQRSLSLRNAQVEMLDEVYEHVVRPHQEFDELGQALPAKDKIYGLPIRMDSLVMYYNKDIFDKAGITELPRTWFNFVETVKSLTTKTESNRILQSGAAIGTANNVNYFFDIVSLLMMQSGAQIIDKDDVIRFAQRPAGSDFDEAPAINAVQFYVDFASTFKEAYTWNEKLPNSRRAFMQGRTAMYFGYADDYDVIKQTAPKLNFGISHMPQIQGNRIINSLKYNVEVVSNKSEYPEQSWDFLQFMTRVENLKGYLETVKKPTPLRALIVEQQNNEDLKVFADQLLTSTSWYDGDKYDIAVDHFDLLIEDVHEGKYEYIQEALSKAAERVAEDYFK